MADFFEKNKDDLKGKEGVYFFAQNSYGNGVGILLGKMDNEDLAIAMNLAIEKLTRVMLGDPFNATSFPTQNYSEKKYGGCIVNSLIKVTSSGLSPEYEHMFGVEVLRNRGFLGDAEYHNIQKEFETYKNHGK